MSVANLNHTSVFDCKSRLGVIFALVVLSLVLPHVPILNLVALPLYSFTTTIHECGHAVSCLLTGGHVAGMSIINDGEGHGGLTYCQGGIPLIYTQMGYITTAIVGSFLIFMGRFPLLSKGLLFVLGIAFAIASLVFMSGTVFAGQVVAGVGSMIVGLAIGAGLIWVSIKSTHYWANILLLFLGVQTGLNALNDDGILIAQAMGGMPGTWSDATSMQMQTMIPAPVWAGLWTIIALFLLYKTLASAYKLDRKRQALKTI